MLKIEEGKPWVMWPDILVANFIDYPANKILDYDGDFTFKLKFELTKPVKKKSTLFSKLPSYFGIDLEEYGLLLIVTDESKHTDYLFADNIWNVGEIYCLTIRKISNTISILLNHRVVINYKLKHKLASDDISHIIFGAGNFPKNGFNLNYSELNLHYLSITKDDTVIAEHNFNQFIHNKSFDETGNCNFIHLI